MCAYVQGRVSSNGDIRLPYAVSGLRGERIERCLGLLRIAIFSLIGGSVEKSSMWALVGSIEN